MPAYTPFLHGIGAGRAGLVLKQPAQNVSIYAPNGQLIESVPHGISNNEGTKYVFSRPGNAFPPGSVIKADGQSFTLGNPSQIYEGDNFSSLKPSSKGAFGGGGGAGGVSPGGVVPFGNHGFGPQNLTGQFPNPFTVQFNPVSYNPIQSAPYNFTDVQKFGEQYGQFQRGQNKLNYAQAKNFALDTINTDLASLKNFVPAASALKRNETSVDNQFNQSQRTDQLNSAFGSGLSDLEKQRQDALTYASGRPPDDVTNQALELNIRSAAADRSNAGGFGNSSSVARKTSDLLSANQRIGLSQYGEGLLSNSINQRASLTLAPTEYSNAGSQVSVNPPVSASQLIGSNLGLISQLGSIPATTALGSTVGQNEFTTGLEQQTRQFNASNQLSSGEFNSNGQFQASATNAGIQNSFALDKFGYQVGLAGAYAGAAQTNDNTNVGIRQQQQAQDNFNNALGQSQTNSNIASGAAIIGAGSQAIFGSKGISGIFSGGGSGSVDTSGGGGGYSPISTGSTDNYGVPNNPVSVNSAPPFSLEGQGSGPSYSLPPSAGNGSGSVVGGGGGDSGSGQVAFPDVGAFDARTAQFQGATGVSLSGAGIKPGLSTGAPGDPTVGDVVNHGADTLKAAGITSTPVQNSAPVGVDNSGNQVYSNLPLLKSSDITSGANLVGGLQTLLQPMGALDHEDSSALATVGSEASNPKTLDTLNQAATSNDPKQFVDAALKSVGLPQTSNINDSKTHDPKTAAASAYSAYQLYSNWGHMSPAQKTLGLAALGVQGFRTKEGTSLAEHPVVTPISGKDGQTIRPGLKVGEGIQLLKDGYNVYPLIKQWDQVNTLQKVMGGNGDHKQMAALAQSLGMLGFGPDGATVSPATTEALAKSNPQPTPQFGVGAVAVPQNTQTPQGYRIATVKNGMSIMVPQANFNTATSGLTNTAAGQNGLSQTATKAYLNWGQVGTPNANQASQGGNAAIGGLGTLSQNNPYAFGGLVTSGIVNHTVKSNKDLENLNDIGAGASAARGIAGATGNSNSLISAGGSAIGTGVSIANTINTIANGTNKQKVEAGVSTGASLANPGIGAAVNAGINTYNIATSNASPDQKAKGVRQGLENSAAAYYTFGLSSVGQYADQRFLGGKGQDIRNKLDSLDPTKVIGDKILSTAFSAFGSGKADDQVARDSIRKGFQKAGFLDNNYQLTLPDGTKADLGIDGHGDMHDARDVNQLVDGKGKLRSWQTDYTNDLDVISSMGGTTLSRLLSGGVSKSVDQMGAQIGNAALKNVGYEKDLTPETFNGVVQNQRALYSQAGIKSKSDAYQLLNQSYADKRINESQYASMKQSVDLIFDNGSFTQAQKLMAGRQSGITAAKQLGPTNGVSSPTVVQNILNNNVAVPLSSKTPQIDIKSIISRNKQNYGLQVAQGA